MIMRWFKALQWIHLNIKIHMIFNVLSMFSNVFQCHAAGLHSRQSFDKNENKGISQSKATKSSRLASKIFTVRQYDGTAGGPWPPTVPSICLTEQIFSNPALRIWFLLKGKTFTFVLIVRDPLGTLWAPRDPFSTTPKYLTWFPMFFTVFSMTCNAFHRLPIYTI